MSGATKTKRHYTWLAALSVATFVIYLALGVYYATHNAERVHGPSDLNLRGEAYLHAFGTWDTENEGDAAFYNRLAMGVMQTGLPRNRTGNLSLYAPVYTYFLSACYSVGGLRLLSVSVPQALLGALLAFVSGLAAGRLAPALKPGVTLAAAALVLVNLRFAMSASAIVPTLLLLVLVALALYFAAGPAKWLNVVLLGGIVSVAVFTQTAFFVVAFAIAGWLAWRALKQKRLVFAAGSGIILCSIAAMLGLRAVVARMGDSYKHENTVILWESNNPYYESMTPTSLWERRPGNPWTHWTASQLERERFDEYLKRAANLRANPAVLWIKENPMQYAKLCWIRLYTTLGPITGQMSPRHRLVSTFHWLLIFPAGYYGLWRTRRLPITQMAVLVFLALTCFESLVVTEWYLRYRMPWELLLTVYAAVGYCAFLRPGALSNESVATAAEKGPAEMQSEVLEVRESSSV